MTITVQEKADVQRLLWLAEGFGRKLVEGVGRSLLALDTDLLDAANAADLAAGRARLIAINAATAAAKLREIANAQ